MANGDSGGSFITGFVVGGIVGAIVGIMLAPKSGSETRTDLLEQSEALRARAEELAARVRERVGPTVDSMRERVSPVAEQVSARVRRGAASAETDGSESAGSEGA
jgi:gas vesicle protein